MSEPPEQEEEEPEDAAAGADLEELLDQFREPEEAPRSRANPLWMISAILLSVLGVWLALRASGGSAEEKPESAALAGAMLPGKTSERLPRGEETVDVVEDYLARCKKGMTAQEVRWIVEDFQRAGLGEGPGSLAALISGEMQAGDPVMNADSKSKVLEMALDLGRRQRNWYGATLDGVLQLNQQQKLEVRAKLQLALEADRKKSEEDWDSLEAALRRESPSPFDDALDGLQVVAELAIATRWIDHDLYAPWKLTALTEEQLSITNYDEIEDADEARVPLGRGWMRPVLPADGKRVGDWPQVSMSREAMVLPLTPDQKFPQFGEEVLDPLWEAKLMHPAQLKLHLLFSPPSHEWLLKAMEEATE